VFFAQKIIFLCVLSCLCGKSLSLTVSLPWHNPWRCVFFICVHLHVSAVSFDFGLWTSDIGLTKTIQQLNHLSITDRGLKDWSEATTMRSLLRSPEFRLKLKE